MGTGGAMHGRVTAASTAMWFRGLLLREELLRVLTARTNTFLSLFGHEIIGGC